MKTFAMAWIKDEDEDEEEVAGLRMQSTKHKSQITISLGHRIEIQIQRALCVCREKRGLGQSMGGMLYEGNEKGNSTGHGWGGG